MTLLFRTRLFVAAAIVGALALRTGAVTRLASADGQFWDIQDTSPWSQDSGGIATGGRANPFNGFGYLKLRVRTATGATLVPHQYLSGFGLAHDGSERVDSITPVLYGDILVARGLFAPKDADYLRYVQGVLESRVRLMSKVSFFHNSTRVTVSFSVVAMSIKSLIAYTPTRCAGCFATMFLSVTLASRVRPMSFCVRPM